MQTRRCGVFDYGMRLGTHTLREGSTTFLKIFFSIEFVLYCIVVEKLMKKK